MKYRYRHNDLDVFLLVAIGWIGLLAIIFEAFIISITPAALVSEYNNIFLSFGGYNVKAFTPPITLSNYNHGLIFFSVIMFFFGLRTVIKNNTTFRTRIIFLSLQALYFIFQVLGFIVFGLYPLPAALMALLAGAAIYLFGTELLHKSE